MLRRIKALITGRIVWEDPLTGQREREHLSWTDRWSLFAPHSYEWRWARRYGRRECGCMINPITRRQVLMCSFHAWGER